jgi:glycolate oxidase FAD binding subunit
MAVNYPSLNWSVFNMNQHQDISAELQQRVTEAANKQLPLQLRAGGSKDFYGREPSGDLLDISAHRGIISYEPSELVLTARAGTSLTDIEQILAENNQILPFEPPHFGVQATIGGTIACNLSGPRRPYAGAARDMVLGTKLLNGKSEILNFGGEVMKNVAGYDVSRLMAGAMGTLGILLEVSLKVLPRPEQELTLVHEDISPEGAFRRLHEWSGLPLPVSASCYFEGQLMIRVSGTPKAVRAARSKIGGDEQDAQHALEYWYKLNNHQHGFFNHKGPLWRLSIASDTPPVALEGEWLYEWGGAQRWLISNESPEKIRRIAAEAGGHATLYRHGEDRDNPFQPLSPGLLQVHCQLKKAFDPQGILNPGRMYKEF